MKRMITWLLVFMMLLAFVGCSSEQPPITDDDPEGTHVQDDITENAGNDPVEENDSAFSGDLTEDVVRNYKTAPESNFEYEEVAGGVRITNYTGTNTIVVIPESIAGQQVVEIAPLLFGNESQVRGVFIPSGVTELIGTFTNNAVIEIVICENIQVIGDNTFNSCASLSTVVLGDALRELGNCAFSSCSNLKELYIAPSVNTIDSSYASTVFFWCDVLTIKGEAGSFIESFCAEKGIPFEAK